MANTEPGSDLSQILNAGEAPERHTRIRRWLFRGGVALAAVLLILWWSTRGPAEKVQFKSQPVQQGDLLVKVTATGTIAPINQVDVSSELSGIVKTVAVDFNDMVKVGQVLATLDTTKINAQVLQSEAALEAARSRLLQTGATRNETRSQLERLQKVWEVSGHKIPSQQDLDAAQAAFARASADEASAKAAVAQAQATLEANRTDLAKTVIYSPIRGIVLKRAVEPGQTVASAFQAPVLFTLAEDLRKMELLVDVDEADVGEVKEGQKATFSVDAYPDRTFPARVTQVRYGAQTVGGVVTYKAVLSVDNTDLSLRPGMTATADIAVQKLAGVTLVPNAALRFSPPVKETAQSSDGGSFTSKLFPRMPRRPSQPGGEKSAGKRQHRVWMLKDGNPVPVPVTIGATDGTMTQVVKGDIQPGMELLVDTVTTVR